MVSSTVAVVGVGGIGGYLGGHMSLLPGVQVWYCVRHPFDTLVIDERPGTVTCRGACATTPNGIGPVDWVLLATKVQQTRSARGWLARLCGPATTIVVLQNGLGHEDRVRPLIGGARVVPAIVWFGAERRAPGRITRTLRKDIDLVLPSTLGARDLARLLEGTPLRTRLTDDFADQQWTKLATNIASNPLTAILDLPVNRLPRLAGARAVLAALIDECIAVAHAEGVMLPSDLAERVIGDLSGYADDVVSSMWQDHKRGRSLEYDALTGALVRIGARHGVPTPNNLVVLNLLRALSFPDPSGPIGEHTPPSAPPTGS